MKSVLFVCYGSGHVRMVLPVARALQASGRAEVQVLGLTTAAPAVREAGLPLLQVKDFVEPATRRLRHGERLAAPWAPWPIRTRRAPTWASATPNWRPITGPKPPRRYAQDGRQAFLPRRTARTHPAPGPPDLVVATNSPRGERAAILAARARASRGLHRRPVRRSTRCAGSASPGYADRVCVLNEHVRDFLVQAGRQPREVVVTGNPAFDALHAPAVVEQGRALAPAQGWQRQAGPAVAGAGRAAAAPVRRPPRRSGPARSRAAGAGRVDPGATRRGAVRAGPRRPAAAAAPDSRIVLATGQDWPLPPLLHAVDAGGHADVHRGPGRPPGRRPPGAGAGFGVRRRHAAGRFGLADAAVPLARAAGALDQVARGRPPPGRRGRIGGDAGSWPNCSHFYNRPLPPSSSSGPPFIHAPHSRPPAGGPVGLRRPARPGRRPLRPAALRALLQALRHLQPAAQFRGGVPAHQGQQEGDDQLRRRRHLRRLPVRRAEAGPSTGSSARTNWRRCATSSAASRATTACCRARAARTASMPRTCSRRASACTR
jgi:hypothetical protein